MHLSSLDRGKDGHLAYPPQSFDQGQARLFQRHLLRSQEPCLLQNPQSAVHHQLPHSALGEGHCGQGQHRPNGHPSLQVLRDHPMAPSQSCSMSTYHAKIVAAQSPAWTSFRAPTLSSPSAQNGPRAQALRKPHPTPQSQMIRLRRLA